MSAFNILNSEITCSNCKNIYKGRIQFKFGDTWQSEYEIGNKIKWGGNDIGQPGLSKVKVYGILESTYCPVCGEENKIDEYDITINKDTIVGVKPIFNIEDYFDLNGNYKIL